MRIDPALWREVERWAADELRSLNSQVEFILCEALKRRGVTLSPAEAPSENPQPTTDAATSEDS
ncbi:MAG: hypothetical protein ACKO42_06460 [Gammaproteobacteria bacterium]